MEVIGYQLFIILTIVLTHFFKREWAQRLCILWSIETVVLLVYPPLIIIQLCVVWGTWYLLNKNLKHMNKIDGLERFIAAKPVSIQKIIRSVPESNIDVLHGKEHLKFLNLTINNADRNIAILSGWITKYVVTDQFIDLLENALSRGVNIYWLRVYFVRSCPPKVWWFGTSSEKDEIISK